jgi:hypothetical protein
MRYSRPGMPVVDTEVLERPSLTAEEAQAIAESKPGVELIPNLTPSPPVKEAKEFANSERPISTKRKK